MMDESRRIARQAARLQWIADECRESARRGAPEGWSLELQASALERIAASLLSLGIGRVAGDRALYA
jgi:hypothetical protein